MQNPFSADQYPDLSLAMTPSLPDHPAWEAGNTSGSSLTYMPIPMPTIPRSQPTLQCSDPGMELNQMGIVGNVPYYDLTLASTPDLAYEQHPQAINPTFTAPSLTQPTNRPYDLQAPGIDHIPAWQPDPYTGDLLQFDQPMGLSITAASQNPSGMIPSVISPDLAEYDRPDNLMMPLPMSIDPSMPDLQSPELEQEIHMQDRPGEMVDSNGDAPDLGPDGDNDDDDKPMPPYNVEYQTPGLSHRERKQDMLYRGLKGEL